MTNFDFTNTPGLEAFIHKQIASAVEAERAKSEKRIKELEAALVPFADACRYNIDPDDTEEWRDNESLWEAPAAMALTVGDLRAARSAIKAEGE